MKKCYLALEKGSLQKTVYPLLGDTTIGRGLDCTISIADPTASRKHAQVSFQGEDWIVEDLGSANGVMFANERVDRKALEDGDTFRIGGNTFRFMAREVVDESNQLFETVEILSSSMKEKPGPPTDSGTDPWLHRIHDAIARIPFFSGLAEPDRKKLADTATLHVVSPGEMIIREGDPGRSIYVILDGKVRVFTRDYQGNELELANLEVSQFFGEMSFLSGQPRSSSVAASDTSVIIELSYTSMRNLIKDHPEVKKVLLKYYHDRMGSTEEKRSQAGMDERREEPRVKERFTVSLMVAPQAGPDGETRGSSWEGLSVDISVSGIVVGVEGAEPEVFGPEAQVRLGIDLPEPFGQIRTLGNIQRVKPARTEEKVTLVGIKFESMAAPDEEKLKKFLYGETHI